MRAADAGRVVQTGVLVTAFLQVDDAAIGVLDHVRFATEGDRTGRACLDAGRLETHADTVGAQRALIGLVVFLRDARDVERAASDARARNRCNFPR